MDAWLIAGQFLVLGLVAGVAAIVLGVGAYFGLLRWRERWPLFGALSGLAVFGVWVYAHGMEMAMLAATSGSTVGLGALLSVGCGIALTYGSLFAPRHLARPRLLEIGSPEERLWLLDAVDRLLPQRLDWILTGVLMLPGIAMIHLGATRILLPGPVLFGVSAVLSPLYAAVGLGLRRRAAREFMGALGSPSAHGGDLLSGAASPTADQDFPGPGMTSRRGAPGVG